MKNLLKLSAKLLTIIFVLSFSSCTKTTEPPCPSDPFIEATINGKTYKDSRQFHVSNSNIFHNQDSLHWYIADDCYANCTYRYINNQDSLFNYTICHTNLDGGDTLLYAFTIKSRSPITADTYDLYCQNDSVNIPEGKRCSFTYFQAYHSQLPDMAYFKDSTVTGTLTISKLDMANKVASGTFSLTDIGKNGSNPSKVVIKGDFTDLPLEEF